MTSSTESTSGEKMKSGFTHPVTEQSLAHAHAHNGEYEIDHPALQQAAHGKTDFNAENKEEGHFAHGGSVGDDMSLEFPSQNFEAQKHILHRKEEGEKEGHRAHPHSALIDRAMHLVSHFNMR